MALWPFNSASSLLIMLTTFTMWSAIRICIWSPRALTRARSSFKTSCAFFLPHGSIPQQFGEMPQGILRPVASTRRQHPQQGRDTPTPPTSPYMTFVFCSVHPPGMSTVYVTSSGSSVIHWHVHHKGGQKLISPTKNQKQQFVIVYSFFSNSSFAGASGICMTMGCGACWIPAALRPAISLASNLATSASTFSARSSCSFSLWFCPISPRSLTLVCISD
mmetsp:Transcript_54958/g.100442  ORF Transcript_54958/g.100442 Transcript_54958/m.100442 type:complete len:219 (+) Transcript_54958:940-1596(+)